MGDYALMGRSTHMCKLTAEPYIKYFQVLAIAAFFAVTQRRFDLLKLPIEQFLMDEDYIG